MNEMPRKLSEGEFVLQIRKIGNSVGVILPEGIARPA